MKTALRSAIAAFTLFFSVAANAQLSCLVINNSSYSINPVLGICQQSISFQYQNPTNSTRSINVVITVAGIQVVNECHVATGGKDEVQTYTSPTFTACNTGDILVVATPYNSGSCNGTACSPVVMSSVGGAPLPVSLTAFTAARNGNAVILYWTTSNETNNAGFSIERNTNGNWEPVGFVASAALNGYSTALHAYQFSDLNTNKTMSQYRLRQLDADGRGKYSEVRAVRGTEQDAKTTVYPNPSADGKISVVFSHATIRDILVADLSGRQVKQWNGYNGNSLQVAGLSPGMFTLIVMNRETGERTTEKIMITGKN